MTLAPTHREAKASASDAVEPAATSLSASENNARLVAYFDACYRNPQPETLTMPHAHVEAGASELAARVCHEEQMTFWSGEIMGTLSIGGYLREDWSYEDTISASGAVAADIRSIVESAFDHPELKVAALAPAAVPESVRRLVYELRGFHDALDGRECGDGAFTIRCENGESEQTRLNLRAVLREAAATLLATPSSVQAGEVSAPASAGAETESVRAATLEEKVKAALAQKHVRQLGPNPLPAGCDLYHQLSHLKECWHAGYKGYLTQENLLLWLMDFAAALASDPSSAPASAGAVPEDEPVAEVLWYDPEAHFGEKKPHKIIDASLAFMDAAEIGTKLYARPAAPATPEPAAGGGRSDAWLIFEQLEKLERHLHDLSGEPLGGQPDAAEIIEHAHARIRTLSNQVEALAAPRSTLSASTADGGTAGEKRRSLRPEARAALDGLLALSADDWTTLRAVDPSAVAWLEAFLTPTPTRPDATAEDATPATPAEGR
ncbi:hypothetical protein HNR00_003528 [Methylorubrum rhodinum]|uniref:Uncharacterized protein n=1 Tax=Methylorubrum rhodinum TaxID=29428 RepID=A0A840ZPJ8_9HYPH|nr:hypothetical protein [Methylorubrum rhodinum]MBB5758801.1 hypothetical protein [Methylorubrum rhodinum]